MTAKYVYRFGDGTAEGNATMKALLGGKGANLAEMAGLGIPVPPGFTITTGVCSYYYDHGREMPLSLDDEVRAAMVAIEEELGGRFGDPESPVLMSVRSGAAISMPGMMETVLNVGLNDRTREGLIRKSGDPRFVYDAQRRLIQMYADVVMEKAAGLEPVEGQGIRTQLERALDTLKRERGAEADTDLTADDLHGLVETYKGIILEVLKQPFPEDPWDQLWGAVMAVFQSWNGKRAIAYRRIEGLSDEMGTAVNVQAMVFGNLSDESATGVAFTRNPATGDNHFYGEWLAQAQGEDVVAGTRTPNPLNEVCRTDHSGDLASLEQTYPALYAELDGYRLHLEKHYTDMLDIEFTIQSGKLWMLQCRTGKRNGVAAIRMASEMERAGLISAETAVQRVTPAQLDELLHPIVDPEAERQAPVLARGLPAGPGGATGRLVFTAAAAVEWAARGEQVVLAREETNPEDVEGMRAAVAILTARGGMTSHAALVARGWGMCCIVGAGELEIDAEKRQVSVDDITLSEGDWVTLNGTTGRLYEGQLPLMKTSLESESLTHYLGLCDRFRRLRVRTNADTPSDARRARKFGAEGIGLFRIEHMFYGEGSDEPLFHLRRMILSGSEGERRAALDDLFPFMKEAIKGTLHAMEDLPVTIRLMDPPLHEFVPHNPAHLAKLAEAQNIDANELQRRITALHESNPMMGHRGVRLGVTHPEITEMQARAILEAATELAAEGVSTHPEIMIPLVGLAAEFHHQEDIVRRVATEVAERAGRQIDYLVGTMIEIPRAALTADEIAGRAEFFSFGTNDLTQMGFGFSRDDTGGFMPRYLEAGIMPDDPFATIDAAGIGQLITIGIERGRATCPDLKIGICGEHGGDPTSVHFCHTAGMDYVSCSPFRVPIARQAAAQATLKK